ncbi:hypothetical protein ACH5RR_037763 [Cinchona calisaya]|uniref:Serine-threonine/tyrosine-protein kinase catalytic domain-containing protein n=1 Tax=Cinchona calisaya TaxID=153742 RepID=A0ABD2YB66_9GENT
MISFIQRLHVSRICREGLFSIKSDVFSFGVLVLEIVSSRRNKGFVHHGHNLNLLGHAWNLFKEGRELEIVDSCIVNSYHSSEVLRSIQVALLCVQQSPEDRPDMSSVVFMLGNDLLMPEAKQPSFFMERNIVNGEMSITTLEGR